MENFENPNCHSDMYIDFLLNGRSQPTNMQTFMNLVLNCFYVFIYACNTRPFITVRRRSAQNRAGEEEVTVIQIWQVKINVTSRNTCLRYAVIFADANLVSVFICNGLYYRLHISLFKVKFIQYHLKCEVHAIIYLILIIFYYLHGNILHLYVFPFVASFVDSRID